MVEADRSCPPQGDPPVPRGLWIGVAFVAALRALPYLIAVTRPITDRGVALPIGYVPQDWLAYAALIRQAATESLLPLANPFTTTPQDGRYLLLFHSALGAVCRLTGISSFTALELARPPLLAALLVATWRLAGCVLHDRRHREAACWLVLLGGGFDGVAILAYSILPDVARRDLANVLGWSTFGASFNPLWIAGLALTLTALRWAWTAPCRSPWDTTARVSLGLIAVGLVHSYSAIVVVASLLLWPVLGATFGLPFDPAALSALPGLAGLTAIQAWQSSDAVYRSNAAEAFGSRMVSPFWYPVTLGILLPLALRGWSRWIAERHPMRLPMAAWTLAVMALHSSPLLNGYHFVFHLHVPVCLAAAPELVRLFERLASRPMMRLLVMMAIVPAPLFITLRCLVAIDSYRVPPSRIEALDAIATLPVGNVLADAELSNMIPAFGPHRVYAGQWFMTPDFESRRLEAKDAIAGTLPGDQIRALVARERIRYVVTTAEAAPRLIEALHPVRVHGSAPPSVILELGDVSGSERK